MGKACAWSLRTPCAFHLLVCNAHKHCGVVRLTHISPFTSRSPSAQPPCTANLHCNRAFLQHLVLSSFHLLRLPLHITWSLCDSPLLSSASRILSDLLAASFHDGTVSEWVSE